MDFRIISIGTLAGNPLWGEKAPARTGHATTTLILAGKRTILVDPGLPAQALEPRLRERVNLEPGAITDVFLTSVQPDTTRGIDFFDRAKWWVSESEREAVGVPLALKLREAAEAGQTDLAEALGRQVAVLQRCAAAPDSLAPGVSLFPLPGVTPGLTGLLLAAPRFTVLVTGDAIATEEHLAKAQALPWAVDVPRARESIMEAVEIADLFVPGRDNLCMSQTKKPF